MLEATARAEAAHFWFRGLRRYTRLILDRALAGRGPALVADCGTGTGRNLDLLSGYGPAVGFETAPEGLRHARAAGRRVVRASVARLPLADASVDLATSFDVLYCLDDATEAAAVAEMWRVLRPGGVALVNVAALDLLRGSHSALTHEVRRYTPGRLRARLEAAGFQVERLTFTHMMTFPITLAVRVADRLTGRAPAGSDAELRVPPAPVNAVLDALLRIDALLLGAVDLPIGSSLLCLARKPAAAAGAQRA